MPWGTPWSAWTSTASGQAMPATDPASSSIRMAVIRTTAPIEHGSSGGPLLDLHGRAIGITVDGQEPYDSAGGAIAIPIGSVENALRRLAPPAASTLADTLGRRLGEARKMRVLYP